MIVKALNMKFELKAYNPHYYYYNI